MINSSIDSYCLQSREALISTNKQLMQENEQLKKQNIILNTLLQEMEISQTEAFEGMAAQAMTRAMRCVEEKLLKIIQDQGREMIEFKREMAPLQVKYQEELEVERRAKERFRQERKEAVLALTHPIKAVEDESKSRFIEIIQSMNSEEIEYIHEEREKHSLRDRHVFLVRIIRERWTKERILEPWK